MTNEQAQMPSAEGEVKNQRAKIKMTTQNVKLFDFALSFCTFIFTFCIWKGFV
jgi:hypothetical protein